MMNIVPSKRDFWFLPLGGSGEIGMNLNLYGHDGQWIMLDLGINFHDRLGVEIVMADPSFIENQKERLKGIVVTHAHEDHIGAIPYLWDFFECPIYATPFTAEIIRRKLKEKPWGKNVPIHVIPVDGKFQVGAFDLEYIHLTHSILEPTAVVIKTPVGTAVHSGDWKIDPEPQVGKTTNIDQLIAVANQGVNALICDSTNVFSDGMSGSEETVFSALEEIILAEKTNRIVVSCFSSNLARVHTICMLAEKAGRRICLAGRSLLNMISAAQEQGYLKDLPQIIDDRTAMRLPKHKVLFLTTGSQGEQRAALSRIATSSHPTIRLDKGDLVIFSSRIIPGNEKVIAAVQNHLVKNGCRVLTDSPNHHIHVSGHPAKEELRQMYEWVKPKMLIPTHGEYRHMAEHARFAKECGIKNTFIPENGMIVDLVCGQQNLVSKVETGRLGVDGNGLVYMESNLMKDRARMAGQGAIFATIFHSYDGYMTRTPLVDIIGLTDETTDHENIVNEMIPIIRQQLNGAKDFKKSIEISLRQFMNRAFEKKPLIKLHLIQEEL